MSCNHQEIPSNTADNENNANANVQAMMANMAEMMQKGMKITNEEQEKLDAEARRAKEIEYLKNFCGKNYNLEHPSVTTLVMNLTFSEMKLPNGKATTNFVVSLLHAGFHPDDWSRFYQATDVSFVVRSFGPQLSFKYEDHRGNLIRDTLRFGANNIITGQTSGPANGQVIGCVSIDMPF